MAKRKRRHRITETLDLPLEVFPDTGKATLFSRSCLVLENHGGVLEYAAGLVRVITPDGIARVTGENLALRVLDAEKIEISGALASLEFEE